MRRRCVAAHTHQPLQQVMNLRQVIACVCCSIYDFVGSALSGMRQRPGRDAACPCAAIGQYGLRGAVQDFLHLVDDFRRRCSRKWQRHKGQAQGLGFRANRTDGGLQRTALPIRPVGNDGLEACRRDLLDVLFVDLRGNREGVGDAADVGRAGIPVC